MRSSDARDNLYNHAFRGLHHRNRTKEKRHLKPTESVAIQDLGRIGSPPVNIYSKRPVLRDSIDVLPVHPKELVPAAHCQYALKPTVQDSPILDIQRSGHALPRNAAVAPRIVRTQLPPTPLLATTIRLYCTAAHAALTA